VRLVLAVVLAVCVAACSDGGDDPSSATTTTVVRTPEADAPLAVGDCGDVPAVTVGGALDPATLTPVACDAPHDVEIGAVFDFPAGDDLDFPGRRAVDGYANEQCLARFEPYVGAPYEASSLDYYIVAPDEDGWDDGDRRMACVLYQVDFAPLTGSVADSGL
jgi:hypothetical protein